MAAKKTLMGMEVTESFSGVKGTVCGVVTKDTGCQHVVVKRKDPLNMLQDGRPFKVELWDLSMLKDYKSLPTHTPSNKDLLGKEVICSRTNYKGIATSIEDYAGSDSIVSIQSQTEMFEGRPAKPYSADLTFVKRVDNKAVKKSTNPGMTILAHMSS
jgi:hypothetical protein